MKAIATSRRFRNSVLRLILYLVGIAAVVGLVLFVRSVFAGDRTLNPIILQIGPFTVRWYGLLIALPFIPGYYLAAAEARRKGINPDWIVDFAIVAAISGFLGARLAYVIQNLSYYLEDPIRIISISEGGLS